MKNSNNTAALFTIVLVLLVFLLGGMAFYFYYEMVSSDMALDMLAQQYAVRDEENQTLREGLEDANQAIADLEDEIDGLKKQLTDAEEATKQDEKPAVSYNADNHSTTNEDIRELTQKILSGEIKVETSK